MMKINLTNRVFGTRDFITIPLACAPLHTLYCGINSLLAALTPSMLILAMARFVDTALLIFQGGTKEEEIYIPLIMIVMIIIYQNINGALSAFSKERLNLSLAENFRVATVEKRARLEYWHIESNESWELINRVCRDPAGRIRRGFENLLEITSIVIQVTSVLAILFAQVWWVGLAVIAISVPAFAVAIKGGKASYEADQEAEKFTRRADYLSSVLMGRENVEERSLFGYTKAIKGKWREKFDAARKIRFRANLKYFVRVKGTGIMIALLSIAIAGILIFPLSSGNLSTGMFIALVTGAFNLVQMMSWGLPWNLKELVSNREYIKDLSAFGALSEQKGALDEPVAEAFRFESLEFHNVSFKYPGTDRYVLKGLSLRFEGGRHYAVVGVNGAGKTTLTKLLTGLYCEYEGEIFLNGKTLRDYSQGELKGIFAVVYQDYARYFISLAENITLGSREGDDRTRMEEILKQIGLEDATRDLPRGMDTSLGKIREGGVDLSGGQWQRLAIARAVYRPSAVYILDEPTAALDPVAESEVYGMFGRISAGRPAIFITHRLGAARLADEIVVIDEGRVAELGSHEDLMGRGGIYAEMFESQRSWYQ
ncbi:MAG: ABC transporter ATP-binding protein/permease [Treponema sp.]|jgi:ATP-binding cassette subfamily B protein|nr:ABC transporter ATP-binding protein/permease [Treponema sp.]